MKRSTGPRADAGSVRDVGDDRGIGGLGGIGGGERFAGRRRLLAGLGALTVGATGSAHAQPDDGYGSRQVARLLVSNPPGTVPDVIGRALAQGMSEVRGAPVVVENRPGASGIVAAELLMRAPPDGLTLLLGNDTLVTVLPLLQDKLPLDPMVDLKPIALVATAYTVLVTHPSTGWRSVEDFVAAARARPGGIGYASFGQGSQHHRAMILLQQRTGIRVNHVPYGNSGPLVDVLAGHVPIMWSGLALAIPHIQSGKLVALAVSSLQRQPSLPAVPAMAEVGFPGFQTINWFTVTGTQGVGAATARRIHADAQAVIGTAPYRDRLRAAGIEPQGATPEDTVAMVQADYRRNQALVASGDIRRD